MGPLGILPRLEKPEWWSYQKVKSLSMSYRRRLITLQCGQRRLTLYGHIKTAKQQTIVQQYGDWYTGQ